MWVVWLIVFRSSTIWATSIICSKPTGLSKYTLALTYGTSPLRKIDSKISLETSFNGVAKVSNLWHKFLTVSSCQRERNWAHREPPCMGLNRRRSHTFRSSQFVSGRRFSSHLYHAWALSSKHTAAASTLSSSLIWLRRRYLSTWKIHPSRSSPSDMGISSRRTHDS